ncbi:unnamed protein product [Fraxinus pennsylvanica]|uniref:Pentatricopeptide repeat-containing protein n=1 Tax=Fraxinus pennsylvanica TaxID=56036 RepID=A0AAD2EDR9_9LAMI|nr:unnamed protein product [Fraxinus pennsylvanica]
MGLAKCGEVDESSRLFDRISLRNEVSWNSMLSGYDRNGKWSEALMDLFSKMHEKIRPSEFTLMSMLNACAKLGALEQWEWIHDYIYITKNNIELNVIVVAAIMDMYRKFRNIEMARQVFEAVQRKGLSRWNSMTLGR